MMLIVESGGTKAEWWAGEAGKPPLVKVRTRGFHPFSKAVAEEIIEKEFPLFWGTIPQKIDTFYFYGAGMEDEKVRNQIRELFQRYLRPEHLEIAHDLLGAARSVWKNERGLVAILGTGSIVGYYSEGIIQKRSGGYGYLIGDEGSGFDLGKRLLRLLLSLSPTDPLNLAFQEVQETDAFSYLQQAYRSPQPNRIIAQLALFLLQHRTDHRIQQNIEEAFHAFFTLYVIPLRRFGEELRCVGNIAWHFRHFLIPIASEYGIQITVIKPSAIQGLWEYHNEHH